MVRKFVCWPIFKLSVPMPDENLEDFQHPPISTSNALEAVYKQYHSGRDSPPMLKKLVGESDT